MKEATWFGQPRGLTILFLTNMWEQFSYYGMRALLVYYMTKQLLISQQHSSFIYGAYVGTAYFMPIIGGAIADRCLGKRRSIILGSSLMAAGHFMMAFNALFYVALGTIALGNGFFLPTLPSQVGDLYDRSDERRGWAFNVYYVGINVGGFLAPLVCGTLGELYGWHYGFAAAGFGMLAGLIIYLAGGRYLPAEEEVVKPPPNQAQGQNDPRIYWLLGTIAIAVTIFRGAYEQLGNTIPLWADSGIDRHVGTLRIPMTWFQSLNPLLVIAMTPLLLANWKRAARQGRHPAATTRMATGALILALAYAVAALASYLAGDGPASWLWLLLFFVVITLGELYILPTGLGLFAHLAPPRLGATTVASWYLLIFTGSLFAGFIGSLWSVLSRPAYFLLLAGLGIISAAILRSLEEFCRKVDDRHQVVVDSAPYATPEGMIELAPAESAR